MVLSLSSAETSKPRLSHLDMASDKLRYVAFSCSFMMKRTVLIRSIFTRIAFCPSTPLRRSVYNNPESLTRLTSRGEATTTIWLRWLLPERMGSFAG